MAGTRVASSRGGLPRRGARHVMAIGMRLLCHHGVGGRVMVPRGNSVPHVRIEIVKGRSLEERQQLFQAVHDALMEAFRIPDDDRTQRIVEHEPENFEIPPGSSDRYTLIEITAFPGRSADAKRNLYRTLVQRLRGIAIDPTDVSVVIHEPTLESWGIRGGHSAADVDLGFSLDV
jgi:phenylpyruvate tautomerase PptA (4-oxalocrotonate tautomerase family)